MNNILSQFLFLFKKSLNLGGLTESTSVMYFRARQLFTIQLLSGIFLYCQRLFDLPQMFSNPNIVVISLEKYPIQNAMIYTTNKKISAYDWSYNCRGVVVSLMN